MAKNTEIKQPHLILCEGEDAKYYLMELLKFFIAQDAVFMNYQALSFGGNPDLYSRAKRFAKFKQKQQGQSFPYSLSNRKFHRTLV